jgi:hypothetical protein
VTGQNEPTGGIFITRGMRISVANFTISMSENGEMSTDLQLHLSLDMCPYWLNIAARHVSEAQECHRRVLEAWRGPDGEPRAIAIEAEFEAGMQAIMSAGIAIDAFYASVKEFVDLPADVTARWRTNGTARHKQISEVLRRAFRMDPRSAVNLREAIKEILRFRDSAVHPPADTRAPVRYAELGTATEWRLEAFRAENARTLCGLALSIVAQLVEAPRLEDPAFVDYCTSTRARLIPLLSAWESQYGELWVRSAASVPAV